MVKCTALGVSCNRWRQCLLAASLLLCLIGFPAAAQARATRITIDARTSLVVPSGAMPRGAYAIVDRLKDSDANGSPDLVAPPFTLKLVGARRLKRAARLEYRYPRGVRASRFRLRVWDGRHGRWRKAAQHDDPRRHVVWTHTTLTGANVGGGAHAANAVVDWGMGVFSEFGQFWGEVLSQRANRPACSSDPPGWVQSVTFANDAREPLFSCGMTDPGNANELEVRLVNNRSYGMWVSFSGASPDWAWLNSPGMFYSDLTRMLATKGGIFSSHGNDIYLPPTTEAHLGFHDASSADLEIAVAPAAELVVASGAISILTSRLIGLRNKLMLTPLFTCSANASTLVQNQSLKSIAAAVIACARKSIAAIAAHKMAFLDNATEAWLSIKSKALAEIEAAMAVTDAAFKTADVTEILLGTSGRAVAVKHAFVKPALPQTPPTPTAPVTTQPPQPTTPQNPPTPTAPPPATYAETAGGLAHTWTNYTNAGGTEGPTIGAFQTIQVACALTGFRVADGNTWWYRIASSPWNGQFYVSADAFFNNGQTSGSLANTPFVDPSVRPC